MCDAAKLNLWQSYGTGTRLRIQSCVGEHAHLNGHYWEWTAIYSLADLLRSDGSSGRINALNVMHCVRCRANSLPHSFAGSQQRCMHQQQHLTQQQQ